MNLCENYSVKLYVQVIKKRKVKVSILKLCDKRSTYIWICLLHVMYTLSQTHYTL